MVEEDDVVPAEESHDDAIQPQRQPQPQLPSQPLSTWGVVTPLRALLDRPETGWEQVQDYFGARCISMCHNILALYWELGMTVDALCRQPGKYGSQTMENFAAFVGNQLRGKPYEVSSARKWRRFFEVCSPEEAQRYADWRLGWSQVAVLVTLGDEARRLELAERVVQGAITDEELQAEVTTLRSAENARTEQDGGTPDRRGGLVPRKVFKGMSSLCVDLTRRLDTYVQAYEEFGNMDEGRSRSSAATELHNAQDALRQIQQRITHVLETVHEINAT
jgi:hypothetical protein